MLEFSPVTLLQMLLGHSALVYAWFILWESSENYRDLRWPSKSGPFDANGLEVSLECRWDVTRSSIATTLLVSFCRVEGMNKCQIVCPGLSGENVCPLTQNLKVSSLKSCLPNAKKFSIIFLYQTCTCTPKGAGWRREMDVTYRNTFSSKAEVVVRPWTPRHKVHVTLRASVYSNFHGGQYCG